MSQQQPYSPDEAPTLDSAPQKQNSWVWVWVTIGGALVLVAIAVVLFLLLLKPSTEDTSLQGAPIENQEERRLPGEFTEEQIQEMVTEAMTPEGEPFPADTKNAMPDKVGEFTARDNNQPNIANYENANQDIYGVMAWPNFVKENYFSEEATQGKQEIKGWLCGPSEQDPEDAECVKQDEKSRIIFLVFGTSDDMAGAAEFGEQFLAEYEKLPSNPQ